MLGLYASGLNKVTSIKHNILKLIKNPNSKVKQAGILIINGEKPDLWLLDISRMLTLPIQVSEDNISP